MSKKSKKDDIQWHPVFLSSIKEAFRVQIGNLYTTLSKTSNVLTNFY